MRCNNVKVMCTLGEGLPVLEDDEEMQGSPVLRQKIFCQSAPVFWNPKPVCLQSPLSTFNNTAYFEEHAILSYCSIVYLCDRYFVVVLVVTSAACDWPGPIRHGSFSHNASSYELLATIDVKCDDGYELIGSRKLQCVTGCEWSRPTPECQSKRKQMETN